MQVQLLGLQFRIEAVRGQYNETYFSTMKTLVQMLAKHDIYVLVDVHQDIFNEKYCGEGVPDWAAQAPGTGMLFHWNNTIVICAVGAQAFPEPLAAGYSTNASSPYPSPEDCAKFSWPTYQVS